MAERKLASEDEWRFELGYLDEANPDKPTHVFAGIWEDPPGVLCWTKHLIAERPKPLTPDELAAVPLAD
jgi:hypothetical protein